MPATTTTVHHGKSFASAFPKTIIPSLSLKHGDFVMLVTSVLKNA
jgi:hypothetical protein